MGVNYTPDFVSYTGQGAFKYWCQTVLPLVYDDSLSYYELLNKVVAYLNNVVSDVSATETNVESLRTAYVQLQQYANDYFDNLDVQQEINEKLDQMASDGSLNEIIDPVIAASASDWLDEHITPTTPPVDNTLSVSGAAADAKTVGDKAYLWRSALSDGDDADTIVKPGSYAKPSSANISNLPTQNSGFLYVFTVGEGSVYQMYQSVYNHLYIRARSSSGFGTWKDLTDTIPYDSGFVADRAVLTASDDADNITTCGSYSKASGVSVANIPTTESGYLYVFTSGSSCYQMFQTVNNKLYWRKSGQSWSDLSARLGAKADVTSAYISMRRTLTSSDDANNITEAGSYSKPSSVTVANIPSQDSGFLIVLAGNPVLQMYVTVNSFLFMRRGTSAWFTVCGSTTYDQRLTGKTIIGLGDSLMYGQGMSNQNNTWFNRVAIKFAMNFANYGISGSMITFVSSGDGSMCDRLPAIISDNSACDYFVLEGGANDMWQSAPIGTPGDTVNTTFCGAIKWIYDQVKTAYPQVRFLFLTNWDRMNRTNSTTGLTDEDYVNAAIQTCKKWGIPYLDNYHDIGISIKNASDRTWFFSSSNHITIDGNLWYAPIYMKRLQEI